ncbi:MAG: ribosome biogenesis GTPase YlqF [Mycoplasmoidaceae bacterium]|nr:MAG: ribosome biogenesis GTPase YlqF [Mycoplasmoidaceae bacterium]
MLINWFPGHMASAIKKIKQVKPLDLIIEIVDARAITISKNEELLKELNKPKMTIALKEDLSDTKTLNVPDDVLVGSIKDVNFKREVLDMIYDFFKDKISNLKAKGLLVPQFYIMVVGLPNVGKSSFINFVSSYGTKALVENKPGLTRKNQMIKINDNLFLYDTPGIMIKRIENQEHGYVLGLLNLIKKEVLPLKETCMWAFNYLKNKYTEQFFKFFPNPLHINFEDFISSLCRRYSFIGREGVFDTERAMEFFLNSIRDGNICKVNYEK